MGSFSSTLAIKQGNYLNKSDTDVEFEILFIASPIRADIDKFIGKDYSRIRIGIGKPKGSIEVGDYVLQNFEDDEMTELEKITNNITETLSVLVEKKLDLFSSTVNNK